MSHTASQICAALTSAGLPMPIVALDRGIPNPAVAIQVGNVILRVQSTPTNLIADVMPASADRFFGWHEVERLLETPPVSVPRSFSDEDGMGALVRAFARGWPALARPRMWRADIQSKPPRETLDAAFRELFGSDA